MQTLPAMSVWTLERSPVIALLWECWRLSRRWYLWVLPVAIAVHLYGMERADGIVASAARRGFSLDITLAYHQLAITTFPMGFALAIFATLLALTLGNKSGFPLSFEFRLPIKTPLLVATPMLFLAVLCASLYTVPALLARLLYGIPFPLLSVSVVLGALVIVLLGCSWATNSTPARCAAMIAALVGSVWVYRWLAPFQRPEFVPGKPWLFTADIFALAPLEYAVLAALSLAIFGLTLASIRKQRYGEAPLPSVSALLQSGQQDGQQVNSATNASFITALQDRLTDMFALPCPVQAPWRAELWLELKRNIVPILLFSFLLALFVPVLLVLVVSPDIHVGRGDYLFPLAVLITGIGYAIYNRRLATAGYMSAFEGTRGMGTIKLALIQLLSVGGGCLGGILLVCISLYLSFPLIEEGDLGRQLRALPAMLSERSPLLLFTEVVALLVFYLATIALFICVHVCSVIWGRLFPYGMGLITMYGIVFTFNVNRGSADLDNIKQHMWGFAAAVLLLTVLSVGSVLQLKMLSLREGLLTLLCWSALLACSLYALADRNILLPNQAPELQAFNAALLLLPLMLFALLIWSYDRLRHR